MGRNYKFKNPEEVYFVSFAVVEWLDVYTRSEYKDILIEYKEFTENKVTWLEGKNTIELYNDKFVWDIINYIHNNPVESGLVRCSHEWIYSSATNYQELESIIEVETLTQRLETIK
jgi:hypothetical protein